MLFPGKFSFSFLIYQLLTLLIQSVASGILDVRKMLNFGINVCLGTGRLLECVQSATICVEMVEYNLRMSSWFLLDSYMYVTVVCPLKLNQGNKILPFPYVAHKPATVCRRYIFEFSRGLYV